MAIRTVIRTVILTATATATEDRRQVGVCGGVPFSGHCLQGASGISIDPRA